MLCIEHYAAFDFVMQEIMYMMSSSELHRSNTMSDHLIHTLNFSKN